MTRRNKLIYWISTGWLVLGMASTGIGQLMKMEEEVQNFSHLGYPNYLLTILGIWKLLAVMAVLVPKFTLLKEWAYAGFFFAMSGAIRSHIVLRYPVQEILPTMLLLVLTVISWYFRPADRKIIPFYTFRTPV